MSPILYCGVITLTAYCTPFAGLSQKFGAAWPLELSEMSMSLAHVALREADLLRLHAVDGEAQLRRIHHLLHAHVGGAGNALDPALRSFCAMR